jgi:DNA-directed RNA polymerase specialized sigma24 family protein
MTDDPRDLAYTVQDPIPTGGSTAMTEQTFPTLNGVLSAYAAWEREMFAHPDEAERYAEVLSLTRQQLRDMRLGNHIDSQKFGADDVRVTPLDPDEVSRLIMAGAAVEVPARKTARQEAEDDLVRAGLAPIMAALPIPQLDAVKLIHWSQLSLREAGAHLSIHERSVRDRLNRAYASIKAAIPVDGYRRVRQYLVAEGQKDRAQKEAA